MVSLDDAEQPQDEDQDQQAAKTDIHAIPPMFVLLVKRCEQSCRSTRYGAVMLLRGIILPARKVPHLLDFSALAGK
jgi:hypothetical protein